MRNKDLLEKFTEALHSKVSNKKELVYRVAEILHIEKESSYRRLSGKVHFSVREMGILANEMNISLDSLLSQNSDKTSVFLKMDLSPAVASMEFLETILNEFTLSQQQAKVKDAEVGCMVHSIPVEFFHFYPTLCKFMYFKWGRNHIGGKEYDDFSSWSIPVSLLKTQDKYLQTFSRYKSIFYIWDNPIIWNFVNEIKYHKLINVLSAEDMTIIKEELHLMLDDMEELWIGNNKLNPYNIKLEFYITNFSVSTTGYYIIFGKNILSSISNIFLHSVVHQDHRTGMNIYQWINSMKKFSYLVSGSGERDRKIFLREQHAIIDAI